MLQSIYFLIHARRVDDGCNGAGLFFLLLKNCLDACMGCLLWMSVIVSGSCSCQEYALCPAPYECALSRTL